MLTIKAPGIEFTMPSEWSEVTLKQFLTYDSKKKYTVHNEPYYTVRDAFETFCSDVTQLYKLCASDQQQIMLKLPFLANRPDFRTLPLPETVAGVTPPKELGACTLLQKWTTEQLIQEMTDEEADVDFIALSIQVLAIYLYPLLTNKLFTDASQLTEVTDTIEQLPVTEALPLAAFFLTNYQDSTSTGQTSLVISSPKQRGRSWRHRLFQNFRKVFSRNSVS